MRKHDTKQSALAAARISDLIESLNMNHSEFARYIGLPNGQPQVRRWALGEAIPTARNAALIAARGNGDPGYYQGLDTPDAKPISNVVPIPYGGVLQAGAWRESVEQEFDESNTFPLPYRAAAPWRDLWWYEVKGESMNLKYPDGTMVIAASMFTNPVEPTNGADVIVQRKSVDGTYESTIKEFMRDRDGRTWLIPRSTEPEFQSPIDLANGSHEEEDVVITGIVVYEFKPTYHPVPAGARNQTMTKLDDIMERHGRGEAHASIGETYGITRERVRQIVASMGGETRAKQKERRAHRIKKN